MPPFAGSEKKHLGDDQKKSPVDESKKSLLLMDGKSLLIKKPLHIWKSSFRSKKN